MSIENLKPHPYRYSLLLYIIVGEFNRPPKIQLYFGSRHAKSVPLNTANVAKPSGSSGFN